MNSFTFYKSVPVIVTRKGPHIRKIGGRLHYGFYKDYGDVPGGIFENGKFIRVENTRGNGYAGRHRLMHRKTKAQRIAAEKTKE